MSYERLIQLLHHVDATIDSETDCDQLQEHLPDYVELEIAGQRPEQLFPGVFAHLRQCPDCAEEYEALKTVASLEAEGNLPEADDILAGLGREKKPAPKRTEPVSTSAT